MTKYSAFLFIIVTAIILAGCGKGDPTYRIGVSQCSRDDWRMKMNEEINREMMLHENAVVEIRSADDDNARQIADIRYFKDNDFDIIIAAPNEAKAITPVIKEVYESGVPVIIFDRDIDGDWYTARMGVDNEGLGREAARYSAQIVDGPIRAIELRGLDGSTPAAMRHRGFAKVLDSVPDARIVASCAANWNHSDAVPVADSLLNLYPDVNLIYAHNDRMAIGASEVARRRGLDDIKIVGIDGAPDVGLKAVADSVIDATFLYLTEGHRLIATAMDILEGRPYQREQLLPALSAVDLSNADILLQQNESLKAETNKMADLKARIDDYWSQHSAQTTLFYLTVVILVLLIAMVFLLLRAFWQHRRHQRELVAQNHLLEEQRDRQKQLYQQLDEAMQSKLVFFTNVSHDLRTPLTLIAEPVDQLLKGGNLTEDQKVLVRLANKNVKILQRLINEILDFRKFENNKLNLSLREVNLRNLLGEWLDSFSAVANKRDIRLHLDVQPDCPDVAVDPEKIERVVFNLVSNAIKNTPDNGDITLGMFTGIDTVTIFVEDNGNGISEDDLKNIFDRFYQVEKINPTGSGIGLALVKAFVELHGGKVEVESALGCGSRFTITLPLRHVDTHAEFIKNPDSKDVLAELGTIEKAAVNNPDGKPVVLVVDDNRDMQQLIGQTLSDEYAVIYAADGRQGVRMASKYVPDLVICDVMMPVMGGLECCRTIKDEVSTSHVPVLMLTACALDEQRIEGYDSGADGYLSKPFTARVLKSRCHNLLVNRKRISDALTNGVADVAAVPQGAVVKPVRIEGAPDVESDFYNRFLELFRAEIGNADLSVDEIAASMGLGQSQFSRKIKALTNYTPVELMRSLRLKHARTLLSTTESSISEIAYSSGFSSPAYFSKCYKDTFGESPSDMRKRLGR